MTDTTHKTSLNPAKHLQPTHLTISDTYEYVIVTISTSTSTPWLFRRMPLWMKRWKVAASRESHGATSSLAPWPARHPSRSRRLWLRRGWGPSKTFQWPSSNSLDSVSYSLAHICQYEKILPKYYMHIYLRNFWDECVFINIVYSCSSDVT